ncbi:MAG: hypothetical protein AAGG11_06260 [Pseudomonadota bacterium]
MSKIRFTPKARVTSAPGFWARKTLSRYTAASQAPTDHAVAEQFHTRAGEVRELVTDLISGGLSEGADTALSALAEEDMVDFCILVDLAEPVHIPTVEPLAEGNRLALAQFLDQEPWHSLAVDHDITVALAQLDSIGTQPAQARWYRYAPGLFDLLASIFDRASKEQFMRFVGEYQVLAERDQIRLSDDAQELFRTMVDKAAHEHGLGNVLSSRG